MNKEQATGHLLIFTSALIFGLNYPISKWLLTTYLTPEFYMCARMIVSCALFWGLSLCVPREKLSLKEIGIFLLCSVGGVTGNQLLFVWGLDMTSPIDASVITSGRPIIVLLLSALILRERITRLKTAGVLLGAAGAIWLILLSGTSGGNAASLAGDLCIFASGVVYALYFVFSKPLSEKYRAVTMMKWMFLFAAIQVLPFYVPAMLNAGTPPILAPLDAQAVAAMIFVFFGTSFLGYLLIPMAVRRIRPTTASMYNNLHPIVACVLAVALAQDTLSPEKILAALAILGGVYMVTKSNRTAENP
ncbi:MAG: DMT family transporter [Opitutales bacterium]|nr:DMT family transporter [Opitutales bacterium]